MVDVIFNDSSGVAFTSESRLPCRKLKLSMKRKTLTENVMYYSMLLATHLISFCSCDIACFKWCASYSLRLWNTTRIGSVCGSAVYACYVAMIFYRVFVVLLHQRFCTEQICFLVACDQWVDFFFFFSFSFWPNKFHFFECNVTEAFVALAGITACVMVANGCWVQEEIIYQTFIVNMAISCVCVLPSLLPSSQVVLQRPNFLLSLSPPSECHLETFPPPVRPCKKLLAPKLHRRSSQPYKNTHMSTSCCSVFSV